MGSVVSLVSDDGTERRVKRGFFRRLSVFERIPDATIEELARLADLRRLSRGETLWNEGDTADVVYFVRSGVIKVTSAVADERPITIGFHGRTEFIGYEGRDGYARHSDSAVVFEDAAVLAIDRTALDLFLTRHAGIAVRLLHLATNRSRQLRQRLAMLNFRSAKSRLAGILLELGERFGVRDSRGLILDLRLTHRELAALIGATRETVSVAIVELRNEGLIETENRRIVLLEMPALEALVG